VTNLTQNQLSTEKFSDLYRLRWGIESKYRELKNRLEIKDFNSVKPVSIRQEFFVVMYLSNLAAIIKSEADPMAAASAGSRHEYQSNRSYILSRIKSCIIRLL
jgi:IS4 transposase